ncbi:glycine cleavage system aminomethyltransferase GcvT [Pontibacter sp. G13]|uniref:glycine cleavage system aminomethyltransferase GcvT n=1 Tax=Pontibacter sp. G13 TaxID=3074898 RepID=UPI00288C0E90|nr:glycine cleavage system aminomethyltransferase GcvT [Pontibacter sp. G13]WNJ21365.1 glycine cleavage system aminomethyltransferase GcvT [Pontibacter sp. G13]
MSKQTVLYPTHQALGAKLIPFAGYDMPVRYTGDKKEHMIVREAAGIFDVSHMGEFIVRGPKALELIQQVTSNDASKLVPGKAQYSCLPNHEGGIVDDVIVYHIQEDQYMIVVNAANIEKDWNWISETNAKIGAELIDISEETSLLAVSGPKAEAVLQKLTDWDLSEMGTYNCIKGTFNGAEKSLIATTGYTGERTFEVFVYNEHAKRMWDDILEAGKEFGLEPCGLGARDTLRLEMGYMLYGNDINDTTSPLEAGLGWITKLKKGPFNGSEAISKLKAEGLKRKLVAFKMSERGIPRAGYEVAVDGEVVGKVTSGTMSPMLGEGIGLAYLPVDKAVVGNSVDVLIRNKPVKAEIVKPPFVKK